MVGVKDVLIMDRIATISKYRKLIIDEIGLPLPEELSEVLVDSYAALDDCFKTILITESSLLKT